MRLLEFASNTYSQAGEDGIIQAILKRLPERNKWCVEFGAWDGCHLSNTCRLILEEFYSAVLIEGDSNRYHDLKARFSSHSNVIALNCLVGFNRDEGDDLDAILSRTAIPSDFDLLSIDIDGNDYHVWNALNKYVPKVVCIEHNPTIHTDVEFVQKADRRCQHGSSLLSLTKLAKRKDYELVAVTAFNAIFVRRDIYPLFGIEDNSPRTLREDTAIVSHIFAGMDGTIMIAGSDRALWHNIRYSARLRQLPAVFRVFPDNRGYFRTFCFKAWREVLRWMGRA